MPTSMCMHFVPWYASDHYRQHGIMVSKMGRAEPQKNEVRECYYFSLETLFGWPIIRPFSVAAYYDWSMGRRALTLALPL